MSAQGGDYEIGFTIKDKNGVAISWPDLDDFVISIYRVCAGKKNLEFIFRKGGTGMSSIEIDSLDDTIALVVLNRALTAEINPNELFAEIEIQVTQSGNYINGKANAKETGISLFKLCEAANKRAIQ
jgi:hypothetical protein